jgi:hypothetical protein
MWFYSEMSLHVVPKEVLDTIVFPLLDRKSTIAISETCKKYYKMLQKNIVVLRRLDNAIYAIPYFHKNVNHGLIEEAALYPRGYLFVIPGVGQARYNKLPFNDNFWCGYIYGPFVGNYEDYCVDTLPEFTYYEDGTLGWDHAHLGERYTNLTKVIEEIWRCAKHFKTLTEK